MASLQRTSEQAPMCGSLQHKVAERCQCESHRPVQATSLGSSMHRDHFFLLTERTVRACS
eukprot:6200193-Pleurochrysis_carterae.AAC.1